MSARHQVKTSLPPWLERFFWEYQADRLDVDEHGDLIMARLMARGDWQAMTWLRDKKQKKKRRAFLLKRGWKLLTPRDLNYWALVSGISARERRELVERARRHPDPSWRNRLVG